MTHPTTLWTPRNGLGAALAATLAATLGAGACAPLAGALGFRTARAEDATVAVTNGLAQAVNVYAFPRTGVGEIFVGQVAAGITDTVRVRGVERGATVRLRAAPIGGGTNYPQAEIVLGEGAAWRIP
jgi:hypothetical protein